MRLHQLGVELLLQKYLHTNCLLLTRYDLGDSAVFEHSPSELKVQGSSPGRPVKRVSVFVIWRDVRISMVHFHPALFLLTSSEKEIIYYLPWFA